MITVPASAQSAWRACVKDLAPFKIKIVPYRGNAVTSLGFFDNDIIDLEITRTLYDQASIGNCASSSMDLKTKPLKKVVLGKEVDFAFEQGDRLDVYITPASLFGTEDEWWCPQGKFYVMQFTKDAYSNVCETFAVDALTYFGDKRFFVLNDGSVPSGSMIGWSGYGYPYDFETVACSILNTTLVSNHAVTPAGEGVQGYFIDGYTVREVLSIFAGKPAINYTINLSGNLEKIQFNGNYQPYVLGRRASSIVSNGSWSDYSFKYELSRLIKDVGTQGERYVRNDTASTQANTNGNGPYMQLSATTWSIETLYDPAEDIATVYNNAVYNRRRYDAFTCENMIFDPALELGDQVSVLGPYVSSLLSDDVKNPLLWIEPGNDDTRIKVEHPHDYVPYWDRLEGDNSLVGPIGKLVVNYKAPQIAKLLQSPAPQN